MIEFRQTKSLKDYDSVSLAAMLRQHFIDNYPAHFTQKLDDAIQIASYLHRYDVRRGQRGTMVSPPYIEHPLRVAIRMFKYLGVSDPYLLLAAVLHDTVEDHPHEFADFAGVKTSAPADYETARSRAYTYISVILGFPTANIVQNVSNPVLPAGTSKEGKLAAYQEHVSNVIKVSGAALILKLSDFIDNAGSLHHHYEYGDKKVTYFLDRYEPLIPLYREALGNKVQFFYDEDAALERLDQVASQFEKFRAAA